MQEPARGTTSLRILSAAESRCFAELAEFLFNDYYYCTLHTRTHTSRLACDGADTERTAASPWLCWKTEWPGYQAREN